MRIAVLSYGLPVDGQKRGGIERIAHDLAEGLAQRRHSVTVWTYDARPEASSYVTRSLPLKKFVTTWLGRRLTMGYLGNLLLLLPGYRDYDVIIAHGDSLLLPLLRKPLIRILHGSALGEAIKATSPWRFAFQLGVYAQELLTALIQPGCVAVSYSTTRLNPFVRRVIPNGVDLSFFSREPAIKTVMPSILFTGTLTGRKRGHLLVKWFTEYVRPRHPAAILRMVSPSGIRVPGVEYHTGISDGELAGMYRSAWVYASPSTYEGFGLPYLEAMASGTPVIATPNAGSSELLDGGRYGLLVRDAAFGETLCDVLSDTSRRDYFAAAGRKRAESYPLQLMLDRYEQLIIEVCADHANR